MLSFRQFAVAAFVTAAVLSFASTGRAVEPDRLIPPDADSVAVVNVRQALDSVLVKKYFLDLIKGVIESNQDVQNLAKATGLDATKDIDSVLATTSGGEEGKLLVAIRGKYDMQKFQTALADLAKAKPKELKITQDGATTLYEMTGDGKTNYAAFADGKTILTSPDKAYLTNSLKRLAGPGAPVKKELAESLQKFTGKESVYTAMIVTGEVKKALEANNQTKELAKNLKTLSAAVTLTDAIEVKVTATATDAEGAQNLAQAVNNFKQVLPALVKSLGNEQLLPLADAIKNDMKVVSEQNTASLSLKLSEEVIKKALGQ
jgi:hypothetical protein